MHGEVPLSRWIGTYCAANESSHVLICSSPTHPSLERFKLDRLVLMTSLKPKTYIQLISNFSYSPTYIELISFKLLSLILSL